MLNGLAVLKTGLASRAFLAFVACTVIEIHTTQNNHTKHEEGQYEDGTSIQSQIQMDGLIRSSEPIKQNLNLTYVPQPAQTIDTPYDDTIKLPNRFLRNSSSENDPVSLLYSPTVPKNTRILLLVKGALDHQQKRDSIREIYKSEFLNVRFIVGKSTKNDNLNEEILQEVYEFNDVIIGDFEDTYENLVFKSLAALYWYVSLRKELRPKYVLLIDDDVEVSINDLNHVLESQGNIHEEKHDPFLLCPWKNPKHARVTRRGPWAVSTDKYSESYWPSYCGGACYLVNFEAASRLYEASKNLADPVDVRIEDAFITGVLRKRAGMGIYSTRPICVHHYAKDSVTGKFLEGKGTGLEGKILDGDQKSVVNIGQGSVENVGKRVMFDQL